MGEQPTCEQGAPLTDIKHPLLFEVCSEIGRQLGGVFSVLKSKAPVTTREYGNNYTLIGPLDRKSTAAEVDEIPPPTTELAESIKAMEQQGITVLYGKWLVEGNPRVLLIDIDSHYSNLPDWKAELKEISGIDVPPEDNMSNEAIAFGYLVAKFLQEFDRRERRKAVIAQFHEWRSSVATIYIKKWGLTMATIFTAHATVLGRHLCATRDDFYKALDNFKDSCAKDTDIYHRHLIEKESAHAVNVFTTVSNITAYECEHLLGRKPEGILPNGLNIAQFAVTDENRHLRFGAKLKMRDFVRGHFYGQLDTFNPDNALYFFTAGRYEYKNKGVDLFIDALAMLNERLKSHSGVAPTVIAFLIMPTETSSVTTESLASQAVVKSLRDTVTFIERNIGRKLFERSLAWREGAELPSRTEIISEQEHTALRRRLHGLQRNMHPPVVTHNLVHHDNDPIISNLIRAGLNNDPSDRVKVVFYPEFLRSSNPILPMDYDEFVRGSNLGIFPSYYEPWGYTPAECAAMGIPSVTTDVSGFGSYISKLLAGRNKGPEHGIFITERRTKTYDESVRQTANYMLDFCRMTDWERSTQRNRTEQMGELLDWTRMNFEYVKARKLAMRRAYPESFLAGVDDDHADTAEPWAAGARKGVESLFTPGSINMGTLEWGER